MAFPNAAAHQSPSSATSSYASLAFDYERQLPKPMCGTAALIKMGLRPSQTKCTRRKRDDRNNRKKKAQYREIPIELTPINTLFVTEEEFLRGLHGTTLSESGKGDHDRPTPNSVEISSSIPQFDVKSAALCDNDLHNPSSPERPRSITPRSGNKRFDFANAIDTEELETEDDDYLIFEDDDENQNRSQEKPTRRKIQESTRRAVRERTVEEVVETSQVPSKDDSSISTRDDSHGSPPHSHPRQDRWSGEDEKVLIALRQTILKQQENLKQLGMKNEEYRNRLSASHDRVQALRQDHLGSIDAIIKLQFEREAFEAEAVWLREELKNIRTELDKSNSKQSGNNDKHVDDGIKRRITPKEASSEIRWTRSHQQVCSVQIDHEAMEQQPVEEPASPLSNLASPSHSTGDAETIQALLSREAQHKQSEPSTSPPRRATNLRSPKHSLSFSSQSMSIDNVLDTTMSTAPKRSVRFHDYTKDLQGETVNEQKMKLPASPTTKFNSRKQEFDESAVQTQPKDGLVSRVEAPLPQGSTTQPSTPDSICAVSLSAVPSETSSSGQLNKQKFHSSKDNYVASQVNFYSDACAPESSARETDPNALRLRRKLLSEMHDYLPSEKQLSQEAPMPLDPTSSFSDESDKVEEVIHEERHIQLIETATGKEAAIKAHSEESPIYLESTPESPRERQNHTNLDRQHFKERLQSFNRITDNGEQLIQKNSPQRVLNEEEYPERIALTTKVSHSHQTTSPKQFSTTDHRSTPPQRSPMRQRDGKNESEDCLQVQELSPRSRYLAAVTRPFPDNSTLMLSKLNIDRGVPIKPGKLQPSPLRNSGHGQHAKSKTTKSERSENEQHMFVHTNPAEKFKEKASFPHRNQEAREVGVGKEHRENHLNVSSSPRLVPPLLRSHNTQNESSRFSSGYRSKQITQEFAPGHESKPSRPLESQRDELRVQNLPPEAMLSTTSSFKSSKDKSFPSSLHVITSNVPSTTPPLSPTSPTNTSALVRKATSRVRNREGRDGPVPRSPTSTSSSLSQSSSAADLKRQFIKVKNQASAPTMSYPEANAELRWVKSQQRILENMKINVEEANSSSRSSLGNNSRGGFVQRRYVTESEELVDPKSMEELNKRVDKVRMQLIKATLEANEEREARDDVGMDRDDLPIHYGREYDEVRERPFLHQRNASLTRI